MQETTPEYDAPHDHTTLKKFVEEYLDITRENADACKKDRDYFDGDQISDHVKADLAKRRQPPIFTNKIGPAISGLLGIMDAAESDPECFPRTVSSQNAADVATKTLRYVADRAQYKTVRKSTSDNYMKEGTTAALVDWTGRAVGVSRIRWEDFVYDPLAREHDFSDAQWLGIAKLLDTKDVEAMYPEAYEKLGKPTGDFNDFLDDKSKARWWHTPRRDKLRVVDIYYRSGGEWHRSIFCASGTLYEGPGGYFDDEGASICPIVAVSYEIKRNGDRYGAIRNMVPLQDEVNSRRSRLLHLVNHRQVRQVDRDALATDSKIARQEAAKADGVLPMGYEVVQSPDLAQGQMLILQKAEADLDRMAPTPAVLGRISSASESGRARQMLQQAGYIELARAFGRFEAFEMEIYRRMWWAARQFMDEPTLIRITDDPRAIEFITINEPVMAQVMAPVAHPETGQPMIDPWSGQAVMQPRTVQVDTRNRLASLDMDIVLTTVPDAVSLEQEVFGKLMELAGSTGVSPFDPKFLAFLEMAPLPNKRQTIERIQRLAQDAEQQNAQAAQAQMQVAQEAQGADIAVKQSKAQKDQAFALKAGLEARAIEHGLSHPLVPVKPDFGSRYLGL